MLLPKGKRFFSPQDFFRSWDEVSKFGEFKEDDLLDRKFWLNKFFNSPSIPLWLGYGICWFDNIIPSRSAQFSFVLFDRKLSGREEEIHDILKWVFDEMALRRVTMIVPHAYQAKIRFITKKLGFRREGILRDYYIKEDRGEKAELFGLLREEV